VHTNSAELHLHVLCSSWLVQQIKFAQKQQSGSREFCVIYEFCRNGKFRIQIEISFCSRWPALQAIMNEKLKTDTRHPVGVETMKQPGGE
jgi:hypothetical protein